MICLVRNEFIADIVSYWTNEKRSKSPLNPYFSYWIISKQFTTTVSALVAFTVGLKTAAKFESHIIDVFNIFAGRINHFRP